MDCGHFWIQEQVKTGGLPNQLTVRCPRCLQHYRLSYSVDQWNRLRGWLLFADRALPLREDDKRRHELESVPLLWNPVRGKWNVDKRMRALYHTVPGRIAPCWNDLQRADDAERSRCIFYRRGAVESTRQPFYLFSLGQNGTNSGYTIQGSERSSRIYSRRGSSSG